MKQVEITFRIFRFRSAASSSRTDQADERGRFEDHRVSVEEDTTVLEVLERLRANDPSLVFRRSCHHGSCGTCTCRINGRERLACLTRERANRPQREQEFLALLIQSVS